MYLTKKNEFIANTQGLHVADACICEAIGSFKTERFTKRANNRKDSMQALFLYPAMMVTDIQRELIQLVKRCQPEIKTLLDPYMGSGSTLVAGLETGLSCFGQDINPLAVLIGRVKMSLYEKGELIHAVLEILATARKSNSERSIEFNGIDKWFSPKAIAGLSKLREGIMLQPSEQIRRFMWVALAETVRFTSNDRISTYKLHCRSKEEIVTREVNPILTFEKLVLDNIEQVENFKKSLIEKSLYNTGKYVQNVEILVGDTKSELAFSHATNFDLLVTSPPYGDNQSTIPYGQHSYLPLQWINLADIDPDISNKILESTHFIDSVSIGGSGRKLKNQEAERLFQISPTLCEIVLELAKNHSNKVNKVLNFFNDFEISIQKVASVLKPNAYSIWTIGNRNVGGKEVPNDAILSEFLVFYGFEYVTHIERQILNKKMPFKNQFSSTMKTEKIFIFRKRG